MAVICVFFCLFGASAVRNVSSVMGMLIIVLILAVFVCAISNRTEILNGIVTSREVYTSYTSAWYSCIYYGASSCGTMLAILPMMDTLKNRKDTSTMIVIGFLMNVTVFLMLVLVILAYMPEVSASAVPFFFVIQQLNKPWLNVAYSIIMLCALITTGISLLYTYTVRFRPYVKVKSDKLSAVIILSVFILAAAALSELGLMTLVSKGYTLTVWINIILLIIGVPVMILFKNKQKQKMLKYLD